MTEKCFAELMENRITDSMTVLVIDFFEFIYIENDKSAFFIGHLCQDPVDIFFRSAFVVSTGQSVKLCSSEKYFVLFAIGSDNIKNKKENQNQEYTKKYTFISFDKLIRSLCICNRNYIADHPVVHSESGIGEILCGSRVGSCTHLYGSVSSILEVLTDILQSSIG